MSPSTKKVVAFPATRVRRREHELAFLPAALEVTETPPSPIGRAIGATIIALFCLALAWTSFASVDIVAIAPGRIVPSGRTKVIQPFETGVVRAIHVHDGQLVKSGDVLIELDPTMSEAEVGHLRADLLSSELDVARLRAALSAAPNIASEFHPPEEAPPALVTMHREFLVSQTAEHSAKLAGLDRQLAQKQAERDTIAATIGKLEATIPLLEQKVDVRKYLFDKALGSKIVYLTDYQDLVSQQQDLLVQRSRLHEAEAAVAAIGRAERKRKLNTAARYSASLHRPSKRPLP